MKKKGQPYTVFQKITSIYLIALLAFLTVSTPFIWATQEELAKQQIEKCDSSPIGEEEGSSSNSGLEEKVPTTSSFSEEFLHEHYSTGCLFSQLSTYHKLENADSYTAFHGELLVPPPNMA